MTSVVDEDGISSTTDPLVNGPIFNNEKMSFPKLVDLDVDYQLIKASIYGMNFGVKWQGGSGLAFRGDWQLNVIAQDLWTRSICTDVPQDIAESHRIGTKSVTKLKNVKWGDDVSESPVLRQLKERATESGGDLSVSMTIYFYTRDTPSYLFTNFTLGHVVGTIGIAKPDEAMNFNGDRLLSYEGVGQPHLPLSMNDSCYNYQKNQTNHPYWMYKAPFQVYTEDQRLTVDLSNSLPFDLQCSLRDLGDLWLGIMNEKDNCIELIGKKPLPYREDKNWLTKTGGVVDFTLTKRQVHLLKSSKLVVARVLTAVIEQWQQDEMKTASAPLNLHLECSSEYTVIEIMLQENPKFVRPLDYYVSRLEYQESFEVRLLVTNYGEPLENETIHVFLSNDPIPREGVVPTAAEATTDESGIATFFFRVEMKIPPNRMYHKQPCLPHETKVLPIEGQVYMFKYYANGTCIYDVNNTATQLTCVNDVAILAFSYKELPPEPYTWVRDVGPIFRQYDHLYPVMHQMVNLANYTAVTLPQNLQLLNYSMGLDTSHPSSMPVTRDLSPTERKMILKWLENPIYDTSGEAVVPSTPLCIPPPTLAAVDYHENYFHPPRCVAEGLTFGSTPDQDHDYFKDIFHTDVGTIDFQNLPRPLWRSHLNPEFSKNTLQCSVPHLLEQLQQAIELEFATLPVYLTSLYSIVDGCNTEVYELIRSVIIQEMLHLTQAANILISIGGTPIIDSKDTVPKFPTIGLPGRVLPHLKITLEKASLTHIYKVFMGIEVPHNLSVDDVDSEIFNDTIGQFYQEIESCIEQLGDEIFLGRVEEQVKWPWDAPTVGTVYVVTDVESAKKGINEIVEQGEGAGPLDPTEGDSETLAHFYRFEEIVCQKHLVIDNDTKTYAYTGPPILFDPAGVWPMRDNPSKDCIPPDNNCYTEAKAFHDAYRSLLRKLQEVFSGRPDLIKDAATNMESLAVHARKLMWTKIRDDEDITCGPVWDYNWDD